ncbi:hypothetical protein CDD82_821 [Ophiocordyceps australis]|uniref:AAA+ ATPase domain-containing protein n=1 Tax=Ophiocordyceps australis TaxID=1399860 RepID=A0A2C5ZQ32_9HYPO|nr:hypothetical protein CDD82_821 [Ophiocordyceps australis]
MALPLEDSTFDWALPPSWVRPTIPEGAGLICETTRLDSFFNQDGSQIILPAGRKYSAKSNVNSQSALTVTKHWDRHQEVTHTVLVIQSPHMKAALKAVVPEYFSSNITMRHIRITNEPRCLFHYRHELAAYGEDLQHRDPEAAQHVRHLITYMWDTLLVETSSFMLFADPSVDEPMLECKYLWMIFKPGDIVFVRKLRLVFEFQHMVLKYDAWELEGHHIDYDGTQYGFRSFKASIEKYDGLKLLRDLTSVPFHQLLYSEQQDLREQLVARGRKFIGIHEHEYLWYDGKCDLYGKSNRISQAWVKGRIVADHTAFDMWCSKADKVHLADHKEKFNIDSAHRAMSEDVLMLCNTEVRGYSLSDNEWGVFNVDLISGKYFDSEAFHALMLPKEQKKQILSLIRGHDYFRYASFLKDKGRGTVILLHGDPGTGKTLTAESVSDYCKKPLLRLDSSTLGISVSSVERGLTTAFDLAYRWDALVLLDEADIYLEQRQSKNLNHNALVSAFLRMLECHQGILFLTTNRINSFDRAFMSRIHLAVHYPPLTKSSRRELWYTFLKRISPMSAEELSHNGVLDKLAGERLNGRHIKNHVQTAIYPQTDSSVANT